MKFSFSFSAYDELTGHCNCWIRYNNRSLETILAINRTCSDWFADGNDHNEMNDTVTLYRTGFAPLGHQINPEVPPGQTTIVFILFVCGRRNLRQIKRVLRTIYSTEHYYIIHVDAVKFQSKNIFF